MATRTSVGSGLWSAVGTWDTGVPVDGDTAIVAAGHAVEFDVNQSAWTGLAGLTINGGTPTPGMLFASYGAAGTYYLKLRTANNLAGTTVTNRGRLLANSDGVWGNTGALPFDRNFIIDLQGTAKVDALNLNIALYDTEPANLTVSTYGPKKLTVTASAAADTLTNAGHGWANGTALMFRVSGGSLPAPLANNVVYYIVNTATDTFKVASVSGGTAIDLTTDGSGTIEAYDGHTSTATGQMSVLVDVTADPQWVSDAAVVLADANAPDTYDQQRTTLSAVAAGTITLAANVDSVQFPGALIILVSRNVAIRSNGTSATQPIVDWGASTFTGSVLRCEIRNTAGTGTTFYGYGVNAGSGHTISGTVSGCSNGVNAGSGHTISGTVSGCSSGVYAGSGHTISGTVSECTYGVNAGSGHTISGTVSGCSSGVYAGSGHTISGTVSGCTTGVIAGSGHTISGTISGCTYGVNTGSGHTISGTISGCTSGVIAGSGHTISGTVSGCTYGVSAGSGHIVSFTGKIGFNAAGIAAPNVYSIRILDEGPLNLISRGGLWPSPPTFYGRNVAGYGGRGVYFEDYDQVIGAHQAMFVTGDVIKDTTTVRSGGASSSLQVDPLSACTIASNIPIFEWTEFDVPASAQTRGVYILGSAWVVFPTAAELWFEAEYLSAGSGTAKTLVKSTAVLTDNTTWTKFSVTFTPSQAGLVRYRAYLGKYETASTHKVNVDNMLVTS